ncbi:FHA domain-containing protein (plasmid) [Coraliomargarita sp. W4R53]
MPTLYSPGISPVVVTPRGIVVLSAETSPALVTRIWMQVNAGRGLAAVLEALTGAYGTSLSAIPPFAVALVEDDAVRLAVRGDIAMDIEKATESERITGNGVTTWTERVISGVSRLVAQTALPTAPADLPVADGVVLASVVEWKLQSERDPTPDQESTPVHVADHEPSVDVAQEPEPAPEPISDPEPGAPATPPPGPLSTPAPVPPAPVPPAPPSGLIDSAAVLSLTDTWLPPDFTQSERVKSGEAVTDSVDDEVMSVMDADVSDDAMGVTVIRGNTAPPPASAPAAPPAIVGDHDGETISLAEARAARAAQATSAEESFTEPPPLAPARPPAPGQLRVSTGQVVPLNRTVVFGRRPRSTRITGTDLPHLIALESPQQDISRSHVEVRAEGDSVIATDLNTTNGTLLLRTGAEPVRLHPGEATVVVPGDVLDLGDGITVAIEDLGIEGAS